MLSLTMIGAGECVGLEAIVDGIRDAYFGAPKLGRLHERDMCIEDEYGRLECHKV